MKLWLVAAVTLLLLARQAGAQEVNDASRSAVRDLGYAGIESYQAGDYVTAFRKLDKAYRVLQVPSLGLWSARALIKTNKWVEAAERLREAIALTAKGSSAAVQGRARDEAQQELDALSPRIPRLVVRVEGAAVEQVKITVDRQSMSSALIGEPIPANPGKHTLEGQGAARNVVSNVVLIEGATHEVVLRFQADAQSSPAMSTPTPDAAAEVSPASSASPSSVRKLTGWVLVGTGVAGLVVGGATGIAGIAKKSTLEGAGCRDMLCAPRLQDDVDSYNTLRTVSTIGLFGGAALAAVGAVIVLTAPQSRARTDAAVSSLVLQLSPRGGSVAGSF